MLRKSLKVLVVALFFFTTFANAEKAELRRHTVMADGHPIALWEKSAAGATTLIGVKKERFSPDGIVTYYLGKVAGLS